MSYSDYQRQLTLRNRKNNFSAFDVASRTARKGIFTSEFEVLRYLLTYVSTHTGTSTDEVDSLIDSLLTSVKDDDLDPKYVLDVIMPRLGFDSTEIQRYRHQYRERSNRAVKLGDIFKYYREIKLFDTKYIVRSRLLLVGAGESGKTTLVHRLLNNAYLEKRRQTDGVEMRDLVLKSDYNKIANMNKEVTFTVFDFAGQAEYTHTHQLFFDRDALFLVLYKPKSSANTQLELEDFVLKIRNCIDSGSNSNSSYYYSSRKETATISSNIVFVTSHCDTFRRIQGLFSAQLVMKLPISSNPVKKDIREEVGRKKQALFGDGLERRVYKDTIEVDSKSGTGFSNLKNTLTNLAWSDPSKGYNMPKRWLQLQSRILQLSEEQGIFALSESELITETSKHSLGINSSSAKSAVTKFVSWGLLYRLSNNDLVLQPQRLANVLACMFHADTKEAKVLVKPSAAGKSAFFEANSNVIKGVYALEKYGHLLHDNAVMQQIWGSASDGKRSFDRRFWGFEENNATDVPPFLDLLYVAGLAFPVINPKNLDKIPRSLVPALLRKLEAPAPWDELGDVDRLWEGVSRQIYELRYGCDYDSVLEIKCTSKFGLPLSLFSRLHVALYGYCKLGFEWRQGFVVEMTSDEVYSVAIVFVSYAKQTIYLINGSSNGFTSIAKCKVILALKDILHQEFNSLRFDKFVDIQKQAKVDYQKDKILINEDDMPESINKLYNCLKCLMKLRLRKTGVLSVEDTIAEKVGGGSKSMKSCDSEEAAEEKDRTQSGPGKGADRGRGGEEFVGGHEGKKDTEISNAIKYDGGSNSADGESSFATSKACVLASSLESEEELKTNLDHLVFKAIPDVLELQGISPRLDDEKLQRSSLWILLQNSSSDEVFAIPLSPQVEIISREPWSFLEQCKVSVPMPKTIKSESESDEIHFNEFDATNADAYDIESEDDVKDIARRDALYVILRMLLIEMKIELPKGHKLSEIRLIRDIKVCKQVISVDRDEKKFLFLAHLNKKVALPIWQRKIEEDELSRKRNNDEERLRIDKERLEIEKKRLLIEEKSIDVSEKLIEQGNATRNMVGTIITGLHDVPTLFVIVPAKTKNFFKDFFKRKYRLYFICSHTRRISICGPKNNGYKIFLQREWVKRALPFLNLTLIIANIALNSVGGIQLPDVSHLLTPDAKDIDEIVDHYLGDNFDVADLVDFDKLVHDVLVKLETNDVEGLEKSKEAGSGTGTNSSKTDVESSLLATGGGNPVRIGREKYDDYDTIKRKLHEAINPDGKPWEAVSGLKKVTRGLGGTKLEPSAALTASRHGATAWIFDQKAVEDSFHYSDTPNEAANDAIQAAYEKVRKEKN